MNPNDKPLAPIDLYERMGERATQPFALHILERLAPIDGLSLIDIAAGTGGLAVMAAERGAHVLATDANAAMVDRAAERLRPFERCRAEGMDLHALTAIDSTFDIAVSNFGILIHSTWQQGLAEMVRVVRSEGRIALAMWTHQKDCSPAHVMRRVYEDLFPGRELWPSNLFPLFSTESLAAGLRDAGCWDVDVTVVTADWSPFSSADVAGECDPMFKSFPGYAALDPHEVARLQPALNKAFLTYAGNDGTIRLPTTAFVATARTI